MKGFQTATRRQWLGTVGLALSAGRVSSLLQAASSGTPAPRPVTLHFHGMHTKMPEVALAKALSTLGPSHRLPRRIDVYELADPAPSATATSTAIAATEHFLQYPSTFPAVAALVHEIGHLAFRPYVERLAGPWIPVMAAWHKQEKVRERAMAFDATLCARLARGKSPGKGELARRERLWNDAKVAAEAALATPLGLAFRAADELVAQTLAVLATQDLNPLRSWVDLEGVSFRRPEGYRLYVDVVSVDFHDDTKDTGWFIGDLLSSDPGLWKEPSVFFDVVATALADELDRLGREAPNLRFRVTVLNTRAQGRIARGLQERLPSREWKSATTELFRIAQEREQTCSLTNVCDR